MLKNKKVLRLCTNAILAALFIVLDLISIKMGPIKITFGGLPIILASIMYGPIDGMAVGFVGSFIPQLITYGFGPTTLLWVLPAVIRGLLMGLLFKAFKKSLKPTILGIEIIISSLVVTVLNTIVSIIDGIVWGYPYELALGVTVFRFVSSIITAILYTVLATVIIKAMNIYNNKLTN